MAISSFWVFLVTMALSMVPLIESKGAIPLGMSAGMWGDSALSAVMAWLATVLGGIIVSFVAVTIFLPFRKLLEKIKIFKKLFAHCDKAVIEWLAKRQEKKQNRKAKRELKKARVHDNKATLTPAPATVIPNQSNISFATQPLATSKTEKSAMWGRFLIAFVFCALPIPLSGVWTAGALCSVLKLDFWRSILALAVANTIDCSLVAIFCFWLEDYIDLMLTIIMLILAFVVIYQLLKFLVLRKEKAQSK